MVIAQPRVQPGNRMIGPLFVDRLASDDESTDTHIHIFACVHNTGHLVQQL